MHLLRLGNMIKHIVLLSFVFLSSSKTKVESQKIENKVLGYFENNYVLNFFNVWQKSRKGFETAVARFLKESYSASSGTQNVYVKQEGNPQELCHGFYINDNIVSVLLEDMYLRDMPHLLLPDISASLAHNVIRIETKLKKMFIDANYILMRNRSDIIYKDGHDPFKNSPFALQQVQTKGQITIIAEDCHLIGESVVTLTGITPHVGHTKLNVTLCKFSIEIYQPGLPSPPVITPYFSKEQSKQLQNLLGQPISKDYEAKLQGVVVTLINSSAVFGPEFFDFRSVQKQIFNETRNYIYHLVRRLNKATIRENQGVIELPDMEVMWDDGLRDDEKDQSHMQITSVTLNGLDMAYASLRGGPIQMMFKFIADELRFYRLQVRGKLRFENSTFKGVYDFAAELLDVSVSIQIEVEDKKNIVPISVKRIKPFPKRYLIKFTMNFWRDLVFTPGNFKNVIFKSLPGDTLALAYLIQEAPKAITSHLEPILKRVIEADENEEKNELDS